MSILSCMIPPGEKIVETKKCRISGKEFLVTDKDMQFLDAISPLFSGKKYLFPSLDISPLEMRRTLLASRNQNKLYRRKSDHTGQEIISMFSAEVPFPIYENAHWYSDKWSPLEYGQKINFDKSFFEQFAELHKKVPKQALSRHTAINSEYSNNCANVKDCYLCFNGLFNENCLYCQIWDYSKNCIDCECIFECEHCYHLSLSRKCYACWYSHELTNCQDCKLCYDCIGCSNCIGCYNLRNKNNYLFNEPSTSEAIKEFLKKESSFVRRGGLQEEHSKKNFLTHATLEKIISQGVHKYASIVQSENCIGNEFQSSKNCFDSYYMMGAEDCAYCDHGKEEKDCRYVMNGMKNLSHAYCSQTVGINCSNLAFVLNSTENLSNLYYCTQIFFGVSKCFGSISLHNHEQHCILNTAYSKHEYEELAGKLAAHMQSSGEWWQFFPKNMLPFEYDQSLAQEYFPLKKEEALQAGWRWRWEEIQKSEGTGILSLTIQEYDEKIVGYDTAQKNIDALLQWVIRCEVTGKPFKVIKQELAFYIEHSLPIPIKHPDQRHQERLSLRNKRELSERACTDCGKTIITTYTPQSPEKVLCEECYRKIVY